MTTTTMNLDEAKTSLRIVDAHHHFWDLGGPGHYPWLQEEYDDSFFLGDYRSMCQTFLPEHYRRATAGWNIVGTVHCEAERSRTEQVAEDDFLTDLHQVDPRFPMAVVAHVDFLQPDVEEVLAQHVAHSLVRGIRCKPRTAASRGAEVPGGIEGTLQDPRWRSGLTRLVENDLSWDLRVPYYHLSEAARAVAEVEGLRVVVNHCGLPLDRDPDSLAVWRAGMTDLAALPGVTVKVSELGLRPNRWDAASNAEVVRSVLDIFGHSRCMFASNLPVATLTAPTFDDVVASVLEGAAGSTRAELDELFAGTAHRAYRL